MGKISRRIGALVIMTGILMLGAACSGTEDTEDGGPEIKVVYDDNYYGNGLKTGLGFACVIENTDRTILFDTGGFGDALIDNMEKMGIEPGDIDTVVISHNHSDHTGGFRKIIEANSSVEVYGPKLFDGELRKFAESKSVKVMEVKNPVEICEGVYSTGFIGLQEQSLAVRTPRGIIVIMACGHVNPKFVIREAEEIFSDKVALFMGGIHTEELSRESMEDMALEIKGHGVKYVGLCHITGYDTRKIFKEQYGDRYLEIGAGRTITVSDIK